MVQAFLDAKLEPTPSYTLPLLFFVFATGLSFHSRLVRAGFLAVIFAIAYRTVVHTSTGEAPMNYIYATSSFFLFFNALDFLAITDSYAEFRLAGQTVSPSSMSFFPRFLWCWKLILTPRGIGWAHEPKSVIPPRPKPQSRISFIISQLPSTVLLVFVADAANILLRSHPGFLPGGPSITDVGPLMRFMNVFLFATSSFYALQLQYKLLSIVATAVGLSNPENWPNLMGSWGDAYTIRRLWGRTWHQLMRRWVSAAGNFVAQRVLRLTPGTNLSAYTKLFIAFLISGIIHQMGDYSLQHRDFWAGGSLAFFLSQAVAIMVEDGVIALGKRAGLKDGKHIRLLGYCWTASWFAFCLPMWIDPYFHDGMASGELFSPIGGLWTGDWTGASVKIPLPLRY
ncbi:membrane bound O-acyl transferase family-domain-containing protein [Lentinula aciculospora]|uniref:Membrane bound O-acyl transferase family-domain-containing protein n=1 Tax=Lentinula aciculospora TaxID=153920 RepID=A0A9W9A2K2_9AGAR|nr:membrane bound O-acyl transferase family-domain-containing protein [Lentinula aciculospora]